MPYFYGFDWTYLVLVLPCVLLSLWASSSVKSTFQKYSTQYSIRRITGADAARRVLSQNGVSGVRRWRTGGMVSSPIAGGKCKGSSDVHGREEDVRIGV